MVLPSIYVVEPASIAESVVAVGSSNMELETLKKEHRAYAFLGRGFLSFPEEEKCISEAIIASSTDHPWESIDNTLEKILEQALGTTVNRVPVVYVSLGLLRPFMCLL
ncbi:hypothetical protein SLE2022_027440 [Rubroshorea leprosula]